MPAVGVNRIMRGIPAMLSLLLAVSFVQPEPLDVPPPKPLGPRAQPDREQVVRKRSMPEWELLYKVVPEYPAAAVRRRIQGIVRFAAILGKDGHVERLSLISGHPLLVDAARKAARQVGLPPPTLLGGSRFAWSRLSMSNSGST
jgi:hypothetical protein